MATMRGLKGVTASTGLAAGPLALIDVSRTVYIETGDQHSEVDNLSAAISAACLQITGLIDKADEEAAEILEFQVAMLEDEALSEPALVAIGEGVSAFAAWKSALDAQVREYQTADDAYFQARAADILDIRDRVLGILNGEGRRSFRPGSILVGSEFTPSRFLETDWSEGGAIVLAKGSPSSHVAMLARARGVPMITGLGNVDFTDHETALVDANKGELVLSPNEAMRSRFQSQLEQQERERLYAAEYLTRQAETPDGRTISVMVNVASPEDIEAIDIETCDGVGLMRSEFLFHGPGGLPDEEAQYQAYTKVLDWAGDKPVTIRTLDAGGDKPIDGLTVAEDNPFLGYRGIRLSLGNQDVFKVQLRALARAAPRGNLKVMLPMVTTPAEIERAKALLNECVEELERKGLPAQVPPLGIMVEVPAVAICPKRFAAAAFFSIGSNDLTQYVTASSRDSSLVADLGVASDPAVLSLIGNVVEQGGALGIDVSLCGDAGSDANLLPVLLDAGVETISVAPAALGRIKAAICQGTGN
ncbi:MAG: phosphoenolpyruvate--protein phosphotransferase [Stappiaceae bacterium]